MSKEAEFSQEIDSYIVLKLPLDRYEGTTRSLPPQAQLAPLTMRPGLRKDERRLLKLYFRRWKRPYRGSLPGWREESPVYLLWKGRLACGVYLCDRNEFDDHAGWGQLHYAFVDPQFQGKRLYSLVFNEAVGRARQWGLQGLYLNSDRHILPSVYERWGAEYWKTIPKSLPSPKHSNLGSHNWLVYRIHDKILTQYLKRFASGLLVDVGCGEKPYASLTEGLVSRHVGIDHPGTQHDKANVDIMASAYATGIRSSRVDTVLCTAVLEHLERPQDALMEMARILRPGGYLILSTPLFWHLHEAPRDFFRYTRYGLEYLLSTAGLRSVELRPLSGFVVTFAQEFCYVLEALKVRPLGWVVGGIQFLIQWIAYQVNRWDRSHIFTWMYLVAAQRTSNEETTRAP